MTICSASDFSTRVQAPKDDDHEGKPRTAARAEDKAARDVESDYCSVNSKHGPGIMEPDVRPQGREESMATISIRFLFRNCKNNKKIIPWNRAAIKPYRAKNGGRSRR